jgi:hypothetical protein
MIEVLTISDEFNDERLRLNEKYLGVKLNWPRYKKGDIIGVEGEDSFFVFEDYGKKMYRNPVIDNWSI